MHEYISQASMFFVSQASKHIPLSLYNISKASKDIDLNLYEKKENPTLGNLDMNLSLLVLPC